MPITRMVRPPAISPKAAASRQALPTPWADLQRTRAGGFQSDPTAAGIGAVLQKRPDHIRLAQSQQGDGRVRLPLGQPLLVVLRFLRIANRDSVLEKLGRDLTKQAQNKQLPPLIGRDKDIRLLMQTLMLKDRNNPILIGESGVGKTTIVGGLAQRIAQAVVIFNKNTSHIQAAGITSRIRRSVSMRPIAMPAASTGPKIIWDTTSRFPSSASIPLPDGRGAGWPTSPGRRKARAKNTAIADPAAMPMRRSPPTRGSSKVPLSTRAQEMRVCGHRRRT